MTLDLLRHEVRNRFSAVIGWGTGLAFFTGLYVAIYPEVEKMLRQAGASFFAIYRVVGIELGSFESFAASAIVQFVPVILGIYAILDGTDTLAGQEDRGTLEMLIAMPLHRWQIVTAKALAMLLSAFLILVPAGLAAAVVFAGLTIDTPIGPVDLFVAILSAWPITAAFMMISLFFGSFFPTRHAAAMGATVLFIASYFIERLTILTHSLRPLSRISLFHYFDCTSTLFSEGLSGRDASVFLGTALVFFLLSILSFTRRDVTVHAWPWRRSTADGPSDADAR